MCKVVVLLIKPFVFLTFSLPSASLDLKVPVLAGKRDRRHHSSTCFSENVVVAEKNYIMLSRSLIICDRERFTVTSFNENNRANFSDLNKRHNEAFRGVCFLRIREKALSQFSSWNVKVSIRISRCNGGS